MTTFSSSLFTPPAPITIPAHLAPSLSQTDIESFPAFKTWSATLSRSLSLQHEQQGHPFHEEPYELKGVEVQSVDRFGGGRLGFVKVKADVKNAKGEGVPGIALLRGGSVAMLVILQPDDVPVSSDDERHVILTVQPRIPAGSLSFTELPAGMLDDSGTFSGAAAKELEEEVDLKIPESDLIDLTALAISRATEKMSSDKHESSNEKLQAAMYPSPGGSDEFIPLFLFQKRVKRDTLEGWQGKLTGLRDHGEKITLRLVKFEDLWWEAARDAKALGALALYQGLRSADKITAEGKVQDQERER